MMRKYDGTRIGFALCFFAVLMFFSPASLLQAAQDTVNVPIVSAIPAFGQPGEEFVCRGIDFTPDTKVRVVMMVFPDVENVLGAKAEGLAMKVDAKGRFAIKASLPENAGIYPIRVYDAEDRMLAETAAVVKKAQGK